MKGTWCSTNKMAAKEEGLGGAGDRSCPGGERPTARSSSCYTEDNRRKLTSQL